MAQRETEYYPGAGTIDGHNEDDDMLLLRASVDLKNAGGAEPGARFWEAYGRRAPLLRRVAQRFHVRGVPDDEAEPLWPHAIRFASSYLLSN